MRELLRIILIGLWESAKQIVYSLVAMTTLLVIVLIAFGLFGTAIQIVFWSITILVALFLVGADKEGIQ